MQHQGKGKKILNPHFPYFTSKKTVKKPLIPPHRSTKHSNKYSCHNRNNIFTIYTQITDTFTTNFPKHQCRHELNLDTEKSRPPKRARLLQIWMYIQIPMVMKFDLQIDRILWYPISSSPVQWRFPLFQRLSPALLFWWR